MEIDARLVCYVEREVLPLYDGFDPAHDRRHALSVIDEAVRLARQMGIRAELAYAAAAMHDVGLSHGREHHHLESGRMIREAAGALGQWFSAEEVEQIARAAEDHRASAAREPRSVLGLIVAEADRDLRPEVVVGRTVAYGLSHYGHLSDAEQGWRAVDHLHEKYGPGGYLRAPLPGGANAQRLSQLHALMAREEALEGWILQLVREGRKARP